MIIKLGFNLFKKNIISNLILMLQISLTIVIINLMVGNINLITQKSKVFLPISQLNGGIFMPLLHNDDMIFIKDLKNIDNIYSIDQYLIYNNNTEIPLFAYDEDIAKVFKPDISEGQWISESENTDYISVVMIKNGLGYEIGNVYDFQNFDGTNSKIKIIGELTAPMFLLDLNIATNNLQTNHLFKYYEYKYTGYPIFISLKADVERYTSSKVESQHSNIIVFEENISEIELLENISLLEKYGSYAPLQDVYKRGIDYQNDLLKKYLPYFSCGLSISVIGFIGLVLLNILKSMRTMAILHLVGSPWYKCSIICLESSILTMLLSITLITILYFVVDRIYPLNANGIIINQSNMTISLLLYLIFGIISFLMPRIYLIKNSAIQVFRETIQI